MGRVEGEERRAGTRERLHSETAISRDEAFLNKQQRRRRSILCSFTKCCGIAVFIFCPIVFLFISNVWGPYWQSNLVQRGVHGVHFFSQSVVCLCGGQLIRRFAPCVMTDDWWKLPREWTGLARGKWCPGADGAELSPCGIGAHRTSLDRCVSAKTGEQMGRDWVARTVAWSQVDVSGTGLFPGHLFILHCSFLDKPPGERQVGETCPQWGEISFKGFNGGKQKLLDRNLV